ncbi:hypothetical protein F5Y14DRAFT_301096 [Nemania sp. NC0429]|nr:hypothetical protein F5Y14DRAFT_301096 [Nemania sp. NC0429]
MPPRERRLDELQHDVWTKNKTTFRRLYLTEHKTLKDVKRVMESEYDFPTTPLSTYESKLRDLRLRKKMRKQDWHPVYRHYINSGNRHTALFLNETRIPWDRAWKEIRRSGARESNVDYGIELPADVIMRTPSPTQLVASRPILSYYMPLPWNLGDVSLADISPAAIEYRSQLYDIPSNRLRVDMLNHLEESAARASVRKDESSNGNDPLPDLIHSDLKHAVLHWASTVSQQGLNFRAIKSDIDQLSIVFYRLANGQGDTNDLDVVLNRTPRYVLLKLLERDSSMIQATIDELMRIASNIGGPSGKAHFFSLVQIVWRFRAQWTFADEDHLFWAAELGCVDSCQLLLQIRDCSKGKSSDIGSAFIRSVAYGHVELAKILFRHVISVAGTSQKWAAGAPTMVIFTRFIHTVAFGFYFKMPFGLKTPAVLHILDWLLNMGPDVDMPLVHWPNHFRRLPFLFAHPKWTPTLLESVHYKNSKLHSHLAPHSNTLKTEITRSGIYYSVKEGVDALRTYLHSRPSHTPAQQDELVDIVLTEELLLSHSHLHRHLDFDAINALLHYNPEFLQLRLTINLSAVLYCVVDAARRQGMHPMASQIVKLLIQKGAVIIAETMSGAVETEGTALLELLLSEGADFKSHGALALSTAAKLGNYNAVDWLLKTGVEINATLWNCTVKKEITALASANVISVNENHRIFGDGINFGRRVPFPEPQPLCSPEMCQYFISRGAKLTTDLTDYSIPLLLHFVIKDGFKNRAGTATFARVRSILRADPAGYDLSCTDPCLLATCFEHYRYLRDEDRSPALQLVNLLLEHMTCTKHNCILALLILNHAPESEIHRILDSGADVNAYSCQDPNFTPIQAAASVGSRDLVRLLVEKGADVNRPAKGNGRTALHAACEHYPRDPVEYADNIKLIKFLIAQGADINAPTADENEEGRVTALSAAAASGNFEVVLLLLENGADINFPLANMRGLSALDAAAMSGRLDMVHFLLNLGALSSERGESGYRGAIRGASSWGRQAVLGRIIHHALKNGKTGEELDRDWKYWERSELGNDESDSANEASEAYFGDVGYWEDVN